MKKICLDPGHYGRYNQSTEVAGYYESETMWKLHLYLKEALEKRGFQVITTRNDPNKDLGLYDRGAMAKGCDLFLSLHSNACGTPSVDYSIVYRAHDNLNHADEIALKLATEVGKLMGNVQSGKTGTRKTDSGSEYYGVMRGARAVNVPLYLLLEHSFHTNKAATLWLMEEDNLQKLAELEATVIGEHFGMDCPDSTENFTKIMGNAQCSADQMKRYLKKVAPQKADYLELADIYLAEGKAEGVRGDIAFAQALVETGNFDFGGDVKAEQNNFCGLGATGQGEAGNSFDTPTLGVRAQIQHLQAYASTKNLADLCVDPRYSYVDRGCAPYVEWLGIQEHPDGKGWAAGSQYGSKILTILKKMMEMEVEPMEEVIPDWMKPSTDWMVEQGLMVGDGDGTLRIHDGVTRGELAVILAKYYRLFQEK